MNYRVLWWVSICLFQYSCSGGDEASSRQDGGDLPPAKFGIGRTASPAEIKAWDIDVNPAGQGLPPGSGKVQEGRIVYETRCASCHGVDGKNSSGLRLVAINGDTTKAKAIGNYWPYATTVFDYIRRAMPYDSPGSLTDTEVYGLTAYLLYLNKIVDSSVVLDRNTLVGIKMPARALFVDDDRKGGSEIR